MRSVVEFDRQANVGGSRITEHKVQVMPCDHMAEPSLPSGLAAGDEIGKSDLEGDEVLTSDCCPEREVEGGLPPAEKRVPRLVGKPLPRSSWLWSPSMGPGTPDCSHTLVMDAKPAHEAFSEEQ